ncbi:MAG: hypothetical protein RLZZ332_923 [Actinomycetota bacterium]
MSESLRLDIQELRGIAVLLVVLYHSGAILPSGFVGVDVFFVLSGFVIASSVRRSIQVETFSLWSFIGRRIRRILPALAVLLTIVVFASSWLSSVASRVQTVRTGLFAGLGGANLFLYRFRPDGYFEVNEKTNALLHTWSLSLEEQFYLVFAIAIAIMARFVTSRTSRTVAFRAVALTAVFSFTLSVLISHFGISLSHPIFRSLLAADELDATFAFYLPVTRAWEFLAGVALCLVQRKLPLAARPSLQVVGFLLLLVSATVVPVKNFPGVFALLPVASAVVLLASSGDSSKLTLGKVGPPLRWIGDRSYSWYLWHWPMIQFVYPFSQTRWAQFAAALVSLIPAHLSHKYVEQYFRTATSWRSQTRTGALGVVCVFLPIVTLATTRDLEPSLGFHIDAELGCEYGDISRLYSGGPCSMTFDGATSTAILLGDSHAGHLSEAFLGASEELGMNAILAVRGNSPFLYTSGVRDNANPSETQQLVDLALDRNVDVAVIAQSDYSSNFAPGVDWEQAFGAVLEDLTSSGVRVLIVAQSVLMDSDPRMCSPIQIRISQCDQVVTRDSSQLFAARDRVPIETRLAEKFQGVALFDSGKILCPDETCSNRRRYEWWWRDGGHIAIPASTALTPHLSAAIRELLANE